MGLKVFATPDPGTKGMLGEGLSNEYTRNDAVAQLHGYNRAKGYISIADLIAKVQGILITNPNDCLELIEVSAHGNPQVLNGILPGNVAMIGTQLKTWHTAARLCDEVNIYLTGCNTGVRTKANESIAQSLSKQTPTEASDNVRITVYGSVGYLSGTNMGGTTSTRADSTAGGHYYPPYPNVTDSQGTVHSGSMASQGAASYRGFREGIQI
jgi:hypothetical protein